MKKKMTFSRLVEKIATETGSSKKFINDLLVETVNLNQEELKKTGHNNITGLGRFSLKWHKARKGRNPQSGESIEIAGHNTVNFKPQASLRNHINRHFSRIKPELIEKEKKQTAAKKIISPNLKKEIPTVVKKSEEITQSKVEAPKIERKQEEIKVPTPRKNIPPPPRKIKRFLNRWIWPIILFLLIILFYVFWPSSDTSETLPKDKALTEKKTIKEASVAETPIQKQENIPAKALEKEKTTGTPSGIYKPKNGDYLYRIALNHYKAASLWPIIYKANKNLSSNPEIIIIGADINLPSLEGNIENLTIKDKEAIAEGYLEVYFYYQNKDPKKAIAFLWVANNLDSKVLQNSKSKINEQDFNIVNTIDGKVELETHI